MISLEFVTDFVYEHCENVKISRNGSHFLARCPLCGDSKKSKSKRRFNLDYNSGQPIYHCFNCGESGSFLTLYSILKGITIGESLKDLRGYNPEYLMQKLSNRKKEKVLKEIEYEYHDYILKDCISVDDKLDSYMLAQYQKKLNSFIRQRKINSDILIAYKGEYQGRFIIPIYEENNHIIYFQARSSDSSMIPKYKNPTMTKGEIIFNKHKFDRSKYIIITEGLIDAMSVGDQGTSCLGKEINKDFLKIINGLTDKGIIIALDNDRDGIQSMIRLMKDKSISQNVKYFLLPYKYREYKDINEIISNESINNVYKFIVDNSYINTNAYTSIKTVKWRKRILEGGNV